MATFMVKVTAKEVDLGKGRRRAVSFSEVYTVTALSYRQAERQALIEARRENADICNPQVSFQAYVH